MNSTKKIKLLIITPSLQCGGSEKFVSMVCGHINTQLFSVCLVVVNNSRPFYTITNPAINIIGLKRTGCFFFTGYKKAVNEFDPDIVFSTANHLNLYLAIFRNRFPKKIKFIAREASIVSINSRHAKMPVLYNMLIKKFYHRFDMIICQSAYMQHDLVKNYRIPEHKTTVMHNATPEVPVKIIQAAGKPAARVHTFITIARLSTEKGIERLVHAVGLLTIPFKYFIIGEGDQRNQLQQLIDELQLQDKIILTGEKTEPFAGLDDADLLLVGSYYEGFPNVVLEAGARGIPVIAFNVPGGLAEIITANNGLLVEDNDIIAFASAINTALAAGFNREDIITSTTKRFSVYRLMQDMEKLFLQLAANK
ncbi:MAG: glycosyltransferase [Chitinophagaceae bacterium]|nr:glycosyltransferase [Chitinophagaceae bacterium]